MNNQLNRNSRKIPTSLKRGPKTIHKEFWDLVLHIDNDPHSTSDEILRDTSLSLQ